jgi:broad specificity phosphatase PhoE
LPATVILVRHGATPANLCRPYRLQGLRPDSELAPLGEAQARAAGAALRESAIAQIYCSPLHRAARTAALLAVEAGQAVPQFDDRLREADLGRWSDLTWPEVERRWPEEFRAFEEDAERHGYPEGENLAQVRDRVCPAVEDLAARHDGETIVAVTHGVVLRVLLAAWMDVPLRYARRIPQDNGAFSVVEVGRGTPKVRTINAACHLTGVLAAAA